MHHMRIRGLWLVPFLLAWLFAPGCGGGGGSDNLSSSGTGGGQGSAVVDPQTTPAPSTLGPTVTFISPSQGATGMPTNSVVNVSFSAAMNPSTLENANFFLTDAAGALVPGVVTHDPNNLAATFTPATALLASTLYTVSLTTGAKGAAGLSLIPFTSTFTTGAGPAPTSPFVKSMDPFAGATNVVLNQKVVATFGQAMNPTTLDSPAANFTLMNGAVAVAGTVAYDVATARATFTPTVFLAPNTTYTVNVGAGATDVAGAALVPFTSTFQTGTQVAPPSVIAINPTQGATGVAINRKVTATFDQAMNAVTIDSPATSFRLSSGGNPIAGTVLYNAASSTAVFTPTSNLPIDSLITVTLTAGAQNVAGNSLTPFTSSFTTGSQVGQLPVVLPGTLNNFAVLGGSTVTNFNATTVTGDLGVSPGTAVTGFPPGILLGDLHAGDGVAAQAQIDLTTAFVDAATRGGAPITVAGNIGGMTLPAGLYKSTSSLEISGGDLTLDAKGDSDAVFVFQMASTFTTTVGRQVILIGGAKASNVFWSVGTSATLGTSSSMKGTILSQISITVVSGATVEGRVVTRIGAVTLDGATITRPAP